ncbi:MAG: DUF255 domain-containing protein [Saprospiraceae bacterium]|nr:DUF255 domain-containing protein [Saprospiraceae bacterium]
MKQIVGTMIIVGMSLLILTPSVAQKVKWMTIEEALEARAKEERKIVVDIFTDWCSWCKKMDQSTFQNPFIADYLNEHYYPVKFNAESTTTVVFKDKEYEFLRQGGKGYHQLAVELTQGRLSYPTVVFLDENLDIIQALRGFQSSLRFEQIMTYFAHDYYKTTPWSKFSENFHTVLSERH